MQLTAFEAVNSITGACQAYLGAMVAASGASLDAAAAQAAHDVLLNYFQSSQIALDNQLAASLALSLTVSQRLTASRRQGCGCGDDRLAR